MLIDFNSLVSKYNLKPTGVIHVGAHHGQELESYRMGGIRNIHFIEPCKAAYEILELRMEQEEGVRCYRVACGTIQGEAIMHVESRNKGQSNSLLKPMKHLVQFPDIVFNESEVVEVTPLDNLNIQGCNLLNMDVQGFEAEVLRGATQTLKGIDYIYTEVNRDEVYEGCARIEQLDKLLEDFVRVETNWAGGTWGDALYIREKAKCAVVPEEFRMEMNLIYPKGNEPYFEHYYLLERERFVAKERVYLPVLWTSYYVANRYGQDRKAIKMQPLTKSFIAGQFCIGQRPGFSNILGKTLDYSYMERKFAEAITGKTPTPDPYEGKNRKYTPENYTPV